MLTGISKKSSSWAETRTAQFSWKDIFTQLLTRGGCQWWLLTCPAFWYWPSPASPGSAGAGYHHHKQTPSLTHGQGHSLFPRAALPAGTALEKRKPKLIFKWENTSHKQPQVTWLIPYTDQSLRNSQSQGEEKVTGWGKQPEKDASKEKFPLLLSC